MKISKKYFLIFFISIITFLIVPHLTSALVSDYYSEYKYSQNLLYLKGQYQTKINSIKTYLENNIIDSINVNDNRYVLMFDMNTINTNSANVIIINLNPSGSNPDTDEFIQNTYRIKSLSNSGSFLIKYFHTTLRCTFNNDNSVNNCTKSSFGSQFRQFNYEDIGCNPTTENCLIEENQYFYDTTYVDSQYTYLLKDTYATSTSKEYFIPLKIGGTIYNTRTVLNAKYFFDSLGEKEPSYSYVSNVLDNGNVELTFTFENYNSDSSYGFTISNEISGEEYGVENPFSSLFPKVIPYGNSYSITIPYDTFLYVTLAKYNKIEDSSLYSREEIFTDVLDINNIVFSNPSNPYFSIDYQSKKSIQGRFFNTKNKDSCYVKFSNNSSSQQVSCSESFTINFNFNGYLSFYVKRHNDILYNRNVNVLGNDSVDYPYITYNVKKQDFYSVVTFNVINDNYDINMSYRYSLDNGVTWTDYQLIDKNPPSYSINVFSNSNVIFEIANVRNLDNIIVYDSKSVYVVLDISTASGLNSSTDNMIDKFISLISLNDNLINYINLLWNNIKNSKLFLVIMIPFISSIICAIIYLIRRK